MSHVRSSIAAKKSGLTISGFDSVSATAISAATLTSSGAVSGLTVSATSYITIGSRYLFTSTYNTAASLVAAATAITATPSGSLMLSAAGDLWVFTGNTTASKVTLT